MYVHTFVERGYVSPQECLGHSVFISRELLAENTAICQAIMPFPQVQYPAGGGVPYVSLPSAAAGVMDLQLFF